MNIPTPAALGFPEKFERWRPAQVDALEWLLRSKMRVKSLCAPTGFGKTPAVMAYALITNRPTCFVTEDRGKQDQMMADFESVGLVDLRGRRNYVCDLRPDYNCEEGRAARCPHVGTVYCPSSAAEMRAATSPLVVTNYDKWTSAKKFGMGMSHFTQVVFDEGDQAPGKLASAMQVELNHREIGDLLGLDFPLGSQVDEFVNWKQWAGRARAEADSLFQSVRRRLEMKDPQPGLVKTYLHLRNLCRRLTILATADAGNWIVDEAKNGYVFDPVRVGRYAEALLLLRVPSIVFISATLRPKTMYMVGLPKTAFEFREMDSDFDPKRCPIYYVPTMRVDARARDLSLLWLRLDQIAAPRRDRKGLVHTVSYARREEILQRSRFAPQMLVNPKGEAPTEMIETFRECGPGTILVSPSIGTGYDFKGQDAEWQFLCKIPFPDGRNKIVKARQADDKEYGPYQAMSKMVQIFGRIMRMHKDQGESFIGDDHMEWFVPRYAHLAPKAFHRFYRRVTVLPQPPPRL